MLKSFYDGSDILADDYLEHHGILGMHWGIRRFQPYPEGHKGGKEVGQAAKPRKRKLSKEAKERQRMRSEAADLKAQTMLDEARAEAAKAKLAADSLERTTGTSGVKKKRLKDFNPFARTEEKKRKAIISGDPKKVRRYADLMTTDEYREAINRCDMALDLELQSLKKASKVGETIASGFGSAAKIGSSTISLQNSIADVRNGVSKSSTKWKKWGEKDESVEKAWAAQKRKWEREDRERDNDRYKRDSEKAERDAAYNKMKFMFEYGFDPDTGMDLKDMPDQTLYNVYMRKASKGKFDWDKFKDAAEANGLI